MIIKHKDFINLFHEYAHKDAIDKILKSVEPMKHPSTLSYECNALKQYVDKSEKWNSVDSHKITIFLDKLGDLFKSYEKIFM